MSIDNLVLAQYLAMFQEQRVIHRIEHRKEMPMEQAMGDLLELLAKEVISQREDIYGTWEPLLRANHTSLDTRDDYPYKDSIVMSQPGETR